VGMSLSFPKDSANGMSDLVEARSIYPHTVENTRMMASIRWRYPCNRYFEAQVSGLFNQEKIHEVRVILLCFDFKYL